MRGAQGGGRGGTYLRRALIVVQFTITIGLLVSTLVVRKQFHYLQEQDLGFRGEQVVVTWMDRHMRGQYPVFRTEALRHPGVQQVSLTNGGPGNVGMMQGYNWPGKEEEELGRGIYTMLIDPHTLETLGLELVAGRDLSEEIPSDAQDAYLLNETAVRELGWEEPVGHPFRVWDRKPGQVVGVVRDFHFKSLHHPLEPLVLYMRPEWCSAVTIRLAPQDVRGSLAALTETWDRLSPDYPFHYTFLNEASGWAYQKEERLGHIFGVFFALAVLVACLGLLGLASYAAERRTREVGIRKVLGASVTSVVRLLSGEFTWLVLIANLIAWPLAWLAVQRWLADFPYRTEVGPGVFFLAAGAALLIAWLTVSWQAVRAGLANPVEALRQE
ncbi:MAG: FtsX-like permease family protein [Candidatus Latescibacterota bacterium]